MSLELSIVPSLTGVLEQLDGQRPGLSLYDLVEQSPFVTKPRQNKPDQHGFYRRVVYESRNGMFRYKTGIQPNGWTTWEEILEMTVAEPCLQPRGAVIQAPDLKTASIIGFRVVGYGAMAMTWDIRSGRHLIPLVAGHRLEKHRNHEWNYCWTKENSITFFDRGDFDEIWKAMMLIRVSINRCDPELRIRRRWWSRRTVSQTLFRRHLENAGNREEYVA